MKILQRLFKSRKPALQQGAVMPSPFWSKGKFELYHKHTIYYVLWCKEHLKAYNITIEPDTFSFIKIDYAIWFDHDWNEFNQIVKKHYCSLPS